MRKLKSVSIPREQLEEFLRSHLSALPADAKILSAAREPNGVEYVFVVASETFPDLALCEADPGVLRRAKREVGREVDSKVY